MSETTQIEWAKATFNPWEGCTKVSPGCLNCYAEARNHRFGMDNWGKGKPRRRTSAANWKKPIRWNTKVGDWDGVEKFGGVPIPDAGARPRIFPSLCDWLDDEVPIEWLADFLKLIHDTPNLDWLLLTKRPDNWRARIEAAHDISQLPIAPMLYSWIWNSEHGQKGCGSTIHNPPQNVWLGVSVEDQQRADERIPELLKIPAKVRFLSVEPLLGPVDLESPKLKPLYSERGPAGHGSGIDWVIVGGESGPGARPCYVQWVRSVVRQCKAAGVPCFVKQLGANIPCAAGGCKPVNKATCIGAYEEMKTEEPACNECCGHGNEDGHCRKLNHKKGGDMSEWPEDLRIREFPTL